MHKHVFPPFIQIVCTQNAVKIIPISDSHNVYSFPHDKPDKYSI